MSVQKIVYGLMWQHRRDLSVETLIAATEGESLRGLSKSGSPLFVIPLVAIPLRGFLLPGTPRSNWFVLPIPFKLDDLAFMETPKSDIVTCVDLVLHPEGGEILPVPMRKGKSIPATEP